MMVPTNINVLLWHHKWKTYFFQVADNLIAVPEQFQQENYN